MIISVLNQKGGVGKTTIALSLSAYLSKKFKILVIDADPQNSSTNWYLSAEMEERACFTVRSLSHKKIHLEIEEIKKEYDYIVIDGPPRTTEVVRSCILSSDLILIPCTPSVYDIWASQETVKLIEEALSFKKNIEYAFVINKKIAKTAIGRDAVKTLKDLKVPILKSHICQRVAFAEAAAQGKTVLDIEPNGKSSLEIKKFTKEILKKYGKKNKI